MGILVLVTKPVHEVKKMSKIVVPHPTSRYFYPWAITLVSTLDSQGIPNIITIGASSICSSNPPTVGVAIGSSQYSMGLIAETGDFGVNLPTASQVYEVDFCGSHSGKTVDKFATLNLTPQPSSIIRSPLIAECPVSMECRVIHTVPLGGHNWVIGEILAVHIDEELINEKGELNCEQADPLLACWGEYYALGRKVADWNYSRTRE